MTPKGPRHAAGGAAASPPTLGGAHMRSALLRRTLPVTAAALMAGLLLPSAQAGAAGAVGPAGLGGRPPWNPPEASGLVPSSRGLGPGGGQPLRARVTGATIPGTSTTQAAAPAAPSGLPSKQ